MLRVNDLTDLSHAWSRSYAFSASRGQTFLAWDYHQPLSSEFGTGDLPLPNWSSPSLYFELVPLDSQQPLYDYRAIFKPHPLIAMLQLSSSGAIRRSACDHHSFLQLRFLKHHLSQRTSSNPNYYSDHCGCLHVPWLQGQLTSAS